MTFGAVSPAVTLISTVFMSILSISLLPKTRSDGVHTVRHRNRGDKILQPQHTWKDDAQKPWLRKRQVDMAVNSHSQ
jgi:hypothetical protein